MKTLYKKIATLLFAMLILQSPAQATLNNSKIVKRPNYASLVINANSKKVLFARNAHARRYPASLTKMMTLYIVFDYLKSKKIKLNQKIYTSARASRQPKMKLGLAKGERISVQDAIFALIIKSANDVAVVLAETIAGSENSFANLMTKKARQLGMKNTRFKNASGLHNPHQVTTPYDMAKLAIALQKNHKNYYKFFAKKHFKYKGRTVYGHNNVMHRYNGADGLKTGYINASGYNLVTSVNKNAGKLIGVVMGGGSARQRDDHMINLLNYGYNTINKSNPTYKKRRPARKPEINKRRPGKNIFSVVNNKRTKQKKHSNVFSVIDRT